ncbi:hypothetical protein [Evansella tamaricis]|uniref:Uncharacterized protein n=1 Tax=Evansella tamaricis TaxID=2069301 RepID=A0ABS6JJ69_9BACI|nr:hypothetical protein [Evansella tamaricis]MBU9713691.1 hypothetical protein [Evansella tamaricis]
MVYFRKYYFNRKKQRHVFEIVIDDKNKEIFERYRVVFLEDGTPLTIFLLDDPEEELREQFHLQDFSEMNLAVLHFKLVHILLKDFVEELFVEKVGNSFERDVERPGQPIPEEFQQFAKTYDMLDKRSSKMKKHYLVDFSSEQKHWIIVSQRKSEAYRKLFEYGHQCDKLDSLFFENDGERPEPSGKNLNLIHIKDYFHQETIKKQAKKLEFIQTVIVPLNIMDYKEQRRQKRIHQKKEYQQKRLKRR